MLSPFLKRAWNLFLTLKPLNHFSGAIPVIAGIAYNWIHKDISNTTLLFYFVVFLFFYSSLYQMNELFDYDRDIADPIRKKRPLASGNIDKKTTLITALTLGTITSIILILYKPIFVLILSFLFILNFLYVTVLKQFPYVDFSIISLTFVAKFITGVLLCSSAGISPTTYVIAFFFYSAIAALHCNKKIGRILTAQYVKIKELATLRTLRYGFLLLGAVTLALSSSTIHSYLWTYYVMILIYNIAMDTIPAFRDAFYNYQRWYSTV